MIIPFSKAHGAGNDFLFTDAADALRAEAPDGGLEDLARAICCRQTGAGSKRLRLIERDGLRFIFEMEAGAPACRGDEIRCALPLAAGPVEVTILSVGNPQCVVFVEQFPDDWLSTARAIEHHPRFPDRTNVSFVRVVDEHTVEARFFERGAGETRSSGIGSVGAAAAAVVRGLARSPIRVLTPAGPLDVSWDETVCLTGPAEIVARGEYNWKGASPHGNRRD